MFLYHFLKLRVCFFRCFRWADAELLCTTLLTSSWLSSMKSNMWVSCILASRLPSSMAFSHIWDKHSSHLKGGREDIKTEAQIKLSHLPFFNETSPTFTTQTSVFCVSWRNIPMGFDTIPQSKLCIKLSWHVQQLQSPCPCQSNKWSRGKASPSAPVGCTHAPRLEVSDEGHKVCLTTGEENHH